MAEEIQASEGVAPQPKVVLEDSLLLDRYYEQRALSMLPIGSEPYFQLADIDWGYGFIEDVGGKPSVAPIPSEVESLERVFATNRPVYNFINGQIVITCNLPAGSIPAEQSEQFSCIGVKDKDNKYVIIAVTQPIWVYSDRGISCEIVINTNLGEAANMMVSGR
ncbi:hypothetical protein [Vibrio parahaemolyticus]|uniref:hypothetical protein n=1 Tax=Vibrio parahaemolyticus TaxID=670 RepID=UPI003D819211